MGIYNSSDESAGSLRQEPPSSVGVKLEETPTLVVAEVKEPTSALSSDDDLTMRQTKAAANNDLSGTWKPIVTDAFKRLRCLFGWLRRKCPTAQNYRERHRPSARSHPSTERRRRAGNRCHQSGRQLEPHARHVGQCHHRRPRWRRSASGVVVGRQRDAASLHPARQAAGARRSVRHGALLGERRRVGVRGRLRPRASIFEQVCAWPCGVEISTSLLEMNEVGKIKTRRVFYCFTTHVGGVSPHLNPKIVKKMPLS